MRQAGKARRKLYGCRKRRQAETASKGNRPRRQVEKVGRKGRSRRQAEKTKPRRQAAGLAGLAGVFI